MRGSIVAEETVKHLEQRIDDCLTECIGRFGNLLVGLVTRGKSEVTALVCDNGSRPLDCPLREIRPAFDFHGFRFEFVVGHLLFLFGCRSMTRWCVEFCVRTFQDLPATRSGDKGPKRYRQGHGQSGGNGHRQLEHHEPPRAHSIPVVRHVLLPASKASKGETWSQSEGSTKARSRGTALTGCP